MPDPLVVLGSGILLGLSMAAPPGPVNAMIANEALKSPLHGTATGAGAMTADLTYFILMLFLANYIPQGVIPWFYIVGGAVMIYFAYGALKARPVRTKISGSYLNGLKLGLTNPYQITWWIAYGIPMIDHFSYLIGPSFFLGILIWIFSYPYIVHKVGGLSDNAVIAVKLFSFVVLLAFGVYAIVLGVWGIKG
ncbi:MAG: LysE family transporter [Sulfolobales archaeon]|nr:LysE family transporter [Sulfolobales archaeon]